MKIYNILFYAWIAINAVAIILVDVILNLTNMYIPLWVILVVDIAIIIDALFWAGVAFGVCKLIEHFIDYGKEK